MAKKQSRAQRHRATVAKKQKQKWYKIITAVALFLFLGAAAFALSSNQNATAGDPGIAPVVGAEAPDFELISNTGETMSLSDYRGRPVAVTFMHTW